MDDKKKDLLFTAKLVKKKYIEQMSRIREVGFTQEFLDKVERLFWVRYFPEPGYECKLLVVKVLATGQYKTVSLGFWNSEGQQAMVEGLDQVFID